MYQRRPIMGFPNYEIDTDGTVWSLKQGREAKLKPLARHCSRNYKKGKRTIKFYAVTLCVGNKVIAKSIHRLVAETFLPNIENLPFVCHNDSDPSNNKLSNLRWGNQYNNMKDRKDRNLYGLNKGEINGMSKLKNYQVYEIKTSLLNLFSNAQIAKKFNVNSRTIEDIRKGITWKFI